MKNKRFDVICHLAAQAGVRYSLENPRAYTRSNIDGFLEVLEYCRKKPQVKLVYASSSSVYGGNRKYLFLFMMMYQARYHYTQQLKEQTN